MGKHLVKARTGETSILSPLLILSFEQNREVVNISGIESSAKWANLSCFSSHRPQGSGRKQDYYPILRSFAWPFASDYRDSGLFLLRVGVCIHPSLRS